MAQFFRSYSKANHMDKNRIAGNDKKPERDRNEAGYSDGKPLNVTGMDWQEGSTENGELGGNWAESKSEEDEQKKAPR